MYRHVPSLVQMIPVGLHLFPVEDYIPADEGTTWAVFRIRLNRSGGPSGIRVEHPPQWLHKPTWEEAPETTNWQKVVAILQAELRDGTLDEEST